MRIELGDNLVLKLIDLSMAPELFEIVDANREHLGPWLSWVDETTSVQHSRAFAEHSLQQFQDRTGVHFAIYHDQQLVGGVGASLTNRNRRSAEIGYWLQKSSEGNGLVTRAVQEMTSFLFTTFGIERVSVRCGTKNVRSNAVPKRLGFRLEGILVESEKIRDCLLDINLYAMLQREWSNA